MTASKFVPLLLSLFLNICVFLLMYIFALGCMPINVDVPDLLKCILATLLHFLIAQKFLLALSSLSLECS